MNSISHNVNVPILMFESIFTISLPFSSFLSQLFHFLIHLRVFCLISIALPEMTKLCQNVTTIFIFCNLNFFLKFFFLSQHFFSKGFSPFCALFAIFFQFFLVYGRYLKFFLWYLNFYLGGRKSSRE